MRIPEHQPPKSCLAWAHIFMLRNVSHLYTFMVHRSLATCEWWSAHVRYWLHYTVQDTDLLTDHKMKIFHFFQNLTKWLTEMMPNISITNKSSHFYHSALDDHSLMCARKAIFIIYIIKMCACISWAQILLLFKLRLTEMHLGVRQLCTQLEDMPKDLPCVQQSLQSGKYYATF